MANIISNIRDYFSRPTRSELVELARRVSSKQGVKLTAQLQQQTDSLTKKDIADWRAAHQMAIDYESPDRCRLYDIYADCVLDAHLSGCIAQRRVRSCKRISGSLTLRGKRTRRQPDSYRQDGSLISLSCAWTLYTGDLPSYSWAI